MEITEERFRALARSSPWRWDTLRFVFSRHPQRASFDAGVRAWLRRPDLLRVVEIDGDLDRVIRSNRSGSVARLTSDGGRPVQLAEPRDVVPVLDQDGLVRERPSEREVEYDAPMFQNYFFVALLDPVELADGAEDGPGTRLQELREVEHHGRPAWEALARPTPSYTPRCSCCSLLFDEDSLLDAPPDEAQFELPDVHRVRLDVQTGVCVHVEQIGGTRDGWQHDIEIEAVDEPLPDELFPRPRRKGLARLLRRG